MPAKRVLVSYGVDIDAVAGWLGSYGGEDSVSDISRGVYAGEVGVPRMLKMFNKKGIKATWFIPGHSLETFPNECRAIVDAGHEVGLHGYSHENPNAMTLQQQKDILDKTYRMLTEFVGKPPTGSVAPWWETSEEGAQLLLDYGIQYDHSMHHHDSQCYWLRTGDSWNKIDYTAEAHSWMKPLQRGKTTGLVEIPANWHVDDLPPLMFIKTAPNSHGFVNPRDIEDQWKEMFQWLYDNEHDFVFPITVHPDVSGRPHVLAMHERLIDWINTHEGVEWMTMDEINRDFRARNKPPAGAQMPADPPKLGQT